MEHRIGEVITLPDGRKAKVVEEGKWMHCSKCIFVGERYCYTHDCLPFERTDHKNIIYKEIKED